MKDSSKSTPITTSTTPLITSSILPREEKYIVITKRELTQFDSFLSWIDIYSEICLLVGSALLGFSLSLIPSTESIKDLTFSNCIILSVTLLLLITGFSAKMTKTSTLKKLLERFDAQ